MASNKSESFSKLLNTWVQTIAIVVAGAWAAYTWWHLQFVVPESAPVNVSMNLDLKRGGSVNMANSLVAIELKVVATNPSARTIYLLSSMWQGVGEKLSSASEDKNTDATFNSLASKLLNGPYIQNVDRHATRSGYTVVALGRLFADGALNPGESVQRSLVFYVPQNRYDLLNVRALIPNMSKLDGLNLKWVLDQKNNPDFKLYRVDERKNETPVDPADLDTKNNATSAFGVSESNAQLSLWNESH